MYLYILDDTLNKKNVYDDVFVAVSFIFMGQEVEVEADQFIPAEPYIFLSNGLSVFKYINLPRKKICQFYVYKCGPATNHISSEISMYSDDDETLYGRK